MRWYCTQYGLKFFIRSTLKLIFSLVLFLFAFYKHQCIRLIRSNAELGVICVSRKLFCKVGLIIREALPGGREKGEGNPIPQSCLCSPVPFSFRLLFPWNKCPYSTVPQNPWEGLIRLVIAGERIVKMWYVKLVAVWQPPPKCLFWSCKQLQMTQNIIAIINDGMCTVMLVSLNFQPSFRDISSTDNLKICG